VHTQFLSEYPEGRNHLRDLAKYCEDNIKMDLREIGCEHLDPIELAQDTIA
jgi:hypothetical protein